MKKQESNTEILFPRFISTKVCGKDKLKGSSQDKLADAIATHLMNTDAHDKNTFPRIIGIEGEWGSGKSNVVEILKEEKLKDKFYFFEYDAWGNQEDLQRRSILELLTSQLIENKILTGRTTIKFKTGGEEEVTWEEKLNYLLARKSESRTVKYPKLNYGMAYAALVAILTPIFTFIAYAIKPTNSTWYYSLLSIIVSALPVLSGLILWIKAHRKNKKYGLDYLLAIYNDKIQDDICYETLSVDEPTVKEFKDWMNDISDFIETHNKPNLVIVFDNMDRLPAEKVKSLWSSINTFFAGDGFKNIWVIIPFDRKHLSCAFGESKGIIENIENETEPTNGNKNSALELTNLFIEKTFPIVYRVASPIITDYKEIFDSYFQEAFDNTENHSQDIVNRIYRIEKPEANIRDIIAFINEMVSLKHQWENQISLKSIAIYCLKKEKILGKDEAKNILEGKFLNKIGKRPKLAYCQNP